MDNYEVVKMHGGKIGVETKEGELFLL
jgi:hypothetical protein